MIGSLKQLVTVGWGRRGAALSAGRTSAQGKRRGRRSCRCAGRPASRMFHWRGAWERANHCAGLFSRTCVCSSGGRVANCWLVAVPDELASAPPPPCIATPAQDQRRGGMRLVDRSFALRESGRRGRGSQQRAPQPPVGGSGAVVAEGPGALPKQKARERARSFHTPPSTADHRTSERANE